MKRTMVTFCGLTLAACAAQAQNPAPTKVGIINIQGAIVSTKDGQKAAAELDQKRAPKAKELEAKQQQIQALQDQLRKSSNTASEEVKQKLMRDIDSQTKAYNRQLEDTQAEFEQEQNKLLQDLGGKIMAVIDKYAQENGYAVILDVSNQNSNVLYASNAVDITRAIVELYDKNAPSSAAPASLAPVKPPITAPVKKQPAVPK